MAALLAAEAVLSVWIVQRVPYTEIDWIAYLQEVSTWWDDRQYDYLQIRGDTGPLVYPAGFLYLYQVLRWGTAESVSAAQYVFVAFYVAYQGVVLGVYQRGLLRPIRVRQAIQTNHHNNKDDDNSLPDVHAVWLVRVAMGTLCCSKRLHSIFLLRLFNDGPTMLLLYGAMWLFMQSNNYWNTACVVFSLAVSLKMNVLLFAPGLLLLLLQRGPDGQTVLVQRLALACALPQLVLGGPFLVRFPVSYLRKAFELDRVFFYQWTVNWKFLTEDVFVSKPWAWLLLACHVGTLTYLCVQWLERAKRTAGARLCLVSDTTRLSPAYVAHTLMVSNFVGIAFARTLHYQFYVRTVAWWISICQLVCVCVCVCRRLSSCRRVSCVPTCIPSLGMCLPYRLCYLRTSSRHNPL